MHSRFRMKGVLLAALVAVIASVAMPVRASAEPEPGAKKKGFRLMARALGAMTINRVYCGMASAGQICVDSSNSSTIGGGFWPKGTPDQYVFNSGLQVAGIVGTDGGPWAGDTVGGFFFDPKGTTEHGEEVEPIYNATNAADLAAWPDAACVPRGDATANLFDPLLQTDPTNPTGCRKSASQGDVWFVSSEVNPALTAGRKHPLGVAVETRGMGWNFPTGNEDIIYFIYTFYNITSTNRADYNAIRTPLADILHQRAVEFHAAAATRGVTLPAGGYTITNLFAAFAADMDVAEAGSNYAGVNLPFALGYTYDHSFGQPTSWTFDPSIFSAPGLFAGAGFVGVKYLSSPTGPGEIQLFSNTVNGTPFAGAVNDPRDVVQLYRYLSGTLSPATGDQPCNTGNPFQTHICFVNNTSSADMRFFQSSTPLSLAPGEGGSIVVAYIFAAPAQAGGVAACGSSCDVKPGDGRILTDAPALASSGANLVDSITGFIKYVDGTPTRPADGIVQQDEFTVVPGSLLGKALTAQAVFDAKFLLPFAPEPPDFFLIPGDDQVTVLWKPSTSETSGDPFFAVAGSALDQNGAPNQLYDPNYRQFDVEGYRIYRGRVDAPNELTLLAQFDYLGTVISDYTGAVNPTVDCAPEFTPSLTTGCPGLVPNQKDGTTLTAHRDFDLSGEIVQTIPGKGRLELSNGEAFLTSTDTAVTGRGILGACGPKSACPTMSNTGVPFVYVDATPRNNFRYFYSVTAFDVNSVSSGPTSLESPRNTKSVTPVKPASNSVATSTLTTHILGRGQQMDQVFTSTPSLDPVTGRFSGPFPPANGTSLAFVGQFASRVVGGSGSLKATLDSITMGQTDQTGCCAGGTVPIPNNTWWTAVVGVDTFHLFVGYQVDIAGNANGDALFSALPVDQALASRYGGDSSFVLQAQLKVTQPPTGYTGGQGFAFGLGEPGFTATALSNQGYTASRYNGARWFDGPSPTANETLADPITACGTGLGGACSTLANGTAGFNNSGALTGVTTVYTPRGYTVFNREWRAVESATSTIRRSADYNVYWGTGGLIDSVIDVTHNVPVPYAANNVLGANWGVLNTTAQGAGSFDNRATVLTPLDWLCVEPLRTNQGLAGTTANGGPFFPCSSGAGFALSQTATLGTVAYGAGDNQSTTQALSSRNTANVQANGGFSLYVVGNIAFFDMATLPAAGTVWSLRDYSGLILGGNGPGGAGNNGPYKFLPAIRPFTAVGAEISTDFDVTNLVRAPNFRDLKQVHTVPDPYYVTNAYEQSADNKVIKFVNLPERAIIRIYSSSGVLVNVLEHQSNTFGGELTWNVRNRNNQVVASGVYFYHIEANGANGGSARRVGRMTIVNFAQ